MIKQETNSKVQNALNNIENISKQKNLTIDQQLSIATDIKIIKQEIDRLMQYDYEELEAEKVDRLCAVRYRDECVELRKKLEQLEIKNKTLNKALDYTCTYNVCFKECDKLQTHRSCKDCRKEFALNKARKELENGK